MTETRSLLNKGVWLFACTSLSLTLSGCATIYDGITGPDEVSFNSSPEGATVSFADNTECITPCKHRFQPIEDQLVKVQLDDFPEVQLKLERRIHYGFWFNALLGGLGFVTAAVDLFAGTMWTFDRSEYFAKFKAKRKPPPPPAQPPPKPALPALPDTVAMRRIRERYPEDYMRRIATQYYGEREDQGAIIVRLYLLLLQMDHDRETLDVDEAVRRDHYQHADNEPEA